MGTIEKILEPQSLEEAWESLFVSDDPFGWPFCSDIDSRMLFYPTEGYHLSEEQYRAVLEAARATGDDGFLVSIIEGEGDVIARGDHWWCAFPTYSEYLDLPLVLENTIYSRNSHWGIMVSHEDHAVVGGCDSFINKLRDVYPSWKDDWSDLKEMWKGNPNSGWLDRMASSRWRRKGDGREEER